MFVITLVQRFPRAILECSGACWQCFCTFRWFFPTVSFVHYRRALAGWRCRIVMKSEYYGDKVVVIFYGNLFIWVSIRAYTVLRLRLNISCTKSFQFCSFCRAVFLFFNIRMETARFFASLWMEMVSFHLKHIGIIGWRYWYNEERTKYLNL